VKRGNGKIIIEGDASSDPHELERKLRRLAESVAAWRVEVPHLPDEDLREMWSETGVNATDRMPSVC